MTTTEFQKSNQADLTREREQRRLSDEMQNHIFNLKKKLAKAESYSGGAAEKEKEMLEFADWWKGQANMTTTTSRAFSHWKNKVRGIK